MRTRGLHAAWVRGEIAQSYEPIARTLERWVVDLKLGSLIDVGGVTLRGRLPIRFLIIIHPMLRVSDDVLRLNSFNHWTDHSVPEERILAGDVLKVAAVARNASDAHPRTKLHIGAFEKEFFPHSAAPLLRSDDVKGGADGEAGGEGGCRAEE